MTTESCCSRGTGMGKVGGGGKGGTMGTRGGGGGDHHENSNHNPNNNSSDCAAASDCESDCSQFESSSVQQQDEAEQILKRAEALTMEEVIDRRLRRLRKIMKVYLSQYWGLAEELRTKYRRFYLRHGKSGWRDDVDAERDGSAADGGGGSGDGMREPERRLGIAENVHCAAQGCVAKPLSLSVFCFAHILLDPRQRLYKPCSHLIRTGETCGKPVLQAVVPPLCGLHFHRAQRQATKSLNKVLPGGVKSNPKIHLIVSQYVRVIQNKRRNYRAAALAIKAAKLETPGGVETNGKELVLIQQGGGPPRSSSSVGGVATRATANANAKHEEKKPRANGQAKEKDVPLAP